MLLYKLANINVKKAFDQNNRSVSQVTDFHRISIVTFHFPKKTSYVYHSTSGIQNKKDTDSETAPQNGKCLKSTVTDEQSVMMPIITEDEHVCFMIRFFFMINDKVQIIQLSLQGRIVVVQ